MPLIQTKGAASAQGFGEFASTAANYIEDVFQTWLYTGNGSTQTITNGVDLAGKGGLVWIKGRSGATAHALYDTTRGATKELVTNSTGLETTQSTGLTSFSSTGFNIGALAKLNTNTDTYASWTFRKQSKFFDVVTWTGNGANNRAISHNLGSTPGFIVFKDYAAGGGGSWFCYHRSTGTGSVLILNSADAVLTGTTYFPSVTSTTFTPSSVTTGNDTGVSYVAYLFAHDAGGFGASGTDNVISCGAFDIDGVGNATVTLGYEPQFVIIKSVEAASNWRMMDSMRGMPVSGDVAGIFPNTSSAETQDTDYIVRPTATGFVATATGFTNPSFNGFIYIAIRRGPMRTPTTGTSVFLPNATTNDNTPFDYGFPIDALWEARQSGSANNTTTATRLSGNSSSLITSSTAAAGIFFSSLFGGGNQNSYQAGLYGSGIAAIQWAFRRAPGFFDVVCYTGDGQLTKTLSHNLGAIPELIIVKCRSNGAFGWSVYVSGFTDTQYLLLESSAAKTTYFQESWRTPFTASNFSVGYYSNVNSTSATYVAYLFATVAGVSKVFSYTGNGSSQTINCGFTGGARFVLIKRTDSTGDWYVWDSARGIVAANDPHLSLNSTAAEVTTDDSVDTDSTGFVVNQVAATNVNVTSATYIGLAVA